MSLGYPTQTTEVVFGSKDSNDSRTSISLTANYSDNRAKTEIGAHSKMNLDILYTMGSGESGNSIEIKVEGSPDGTNWYHIPNESVSGGTSTLSQREFTFVGNDAAAATISIALDVFYKHVRVSVKESGVGTNSGTVYAEMTKSGI